MKRNQASEFSALERGASNVSFHPRSILVQKAKLLLSGFFTEETLTHRPRASLLCGGPQCRRRPAGGAAIRAQGGQKRKASRRA